ncbi:MAG: hypothetical protein SGJ21_06550 [Alphaproteobacteria bacterium]|nr:hypothetical protein [Alphaproteobacteria bacterium]
MRVLAAFLCLALVASVQPAFSSPPKAGAEKKDGQIDSVEEKEVARSVKLAGLAFPVFDAEGRLENYLFIDARMRVNDSKDHWKYQDQAHFIRDAVLRAAHRVSFNVKGDVTRLDEKLAAKECLKAANETVGEPDALVTMTFTQIASQN